MVKKLSFIIIFLVGILLGTIATGYFKNKQLSLSQQEKITCQNKLQESSLLYQAFKTNCPLPTSGNMYFSYQLTAADEQGQKVLSINLDSLTPNILADAIDLRLDFNKGIEIMEVIDGNSFSLYPRKIIKEGFVLITGIALGQKSEIQFAKPKTTFIKLKLKTNSLDGKPVISFNRQESKIYLSGTNILDLSRSFSRIEP
jgi:hypothetical protein